MAFCATYQNILDKNLCHIHSGNGFDSILRRRRLLYRRQATDVTWEPSYDSKQFEYDDSSGTFLPKAPAFRGFTEDRVSSVVERLYEKKKDTRVNAEGINQQENGGQNRTLSQEDRDNLTVRLCQPTQISKVRNLMRTNKGTTLTQTDLSCTRCNLPPSRRYFPDSYKDKSSVGDSRLSMPSVSV